MNTFYGCDTAALDDLSATIGERAAQLRTVMEGTGQAAAAPAWFGPDGDVFRDEVDKLVERALGVFEWLRELGELLGAEAAEQSACSAADGESGGGQGIRPALGAELLRLVRDLVRGPVSGLASGLKEGFEEALPTLGRPFMAEDPLTFSDRLPDLGKLGPLIGGPIMRPAPLHPVPAPGPLPEGESFDLDPEILADAQKDRRIGLGAVPFVGQFQMAMGVHDGVGRRLDGAEAFLEDSGLDVATPLVSTLRVPHALAGIALGERSVAGQMVDGIDRQLANPSQVTSDVSDAIGDGDLGGVIRAAERGVYRHVDANADILTATAVPAVADAGSEIAGSTADVIEPLSPAAAAPLREVEDASRQFVEGLEGGHDWLTDGERYYDLRRQHVPLPWDPRE